MHFLLIDIEFNKSHMPHLNCEGWGRLKPSSGAPAPNVPFVPEIFDNMLM